MKEPRLAHPEHTLIRCGEVAAALDENHAHSYLAVRDKNEMREMVIDRAMIALQSVRGPLRTGTMRQSDCGADRWRENAEALCDLQELLDDLLVMAGIENHERLEWFNLERQRRFGSFVSSKPNGVLGYVVVEASRASCAECKVKA